MLPAPWNRRCAPALARPRRDLLPIPAAPTQRASPGVVWRCVVKASSHPPETSVAQRTAAGGDPEVDALRDIAIEQLLSACRAETAKFPRPEPSHDRYCFELFRRASCERDQAAWAAISGAYQPIVAAWFRDH